MNINRNTAAVVAHGNRTIDMHHDFNLGAKTGEMFVDRIVENFENAVMQTAFVRIADVHSGALPDCFEALQFVDLRGVVFLILTDAGDFVLAVTR
jgi:hypothetical protein